MSVRPMTRLMAGVAAAGAIVLGGLMVASPAQAGPNCPSGYHCVMQDDLYDNQYHDYYYSDPNFTDDYFSNGGTVVNDNTSAASNSAIGSYESHYYYDINYNNFAFCVNPGSYVAGLWSDGVAGNGVGLNDEVSSIRERGTTSISCF